MSDVLLEVRDVSLAFGGVRALSGVSFDVRRREVRAIIGPNGAGKSSMLNVLNGVYHPQQGTIRFESFEFKDMDHEGSGLVKFQQWDGAKWKVITDWMEPDRKLVRQKVEDDAKQYAKEKNIEPRDCAKEG